MAAPQSAPVRTVVDPFSEYGRISFHHLQRHALSLARTPHQRRFARTFVVRRPRPNPSLEPRLYLGDHTALASNLAEEPPPGIGFDLAELWTPDLVADSAFKSNEPVSQFRGQFPIRPIPGADRLLVLRGRVERLETQREPLRVRTVHRSARQMNGGAFEPLQRFEQGAVLLIEQPIGDVQAIIRVDANQM